MTRKFIWKGKEYEMEGGIYIFRLENKQV